MPLMAELFNVDTLIDSQVSAGSTQLYVYGCYTVPTQSHKLSCSLNRTQSSNWHPLPLRRSEKLRQEPPIRLHCWSHVITT